MENTFPLQLISDFIEYNNLKIDNVIKLKGDVSTRKYYRIFSEGENFIISLYPENLGDDLKRYVNLTRVYETHKIPVPKILYHDFEKNVAVLEDLGENLLYESEREHVIKFIDEIFGILKKIRDINLKSNFKYLLDEVKLTDELNFFGKYFSILIGDGGEEKILEEEFKRIVKKTLEDYPMVFCHRDFMVRNMIEKNERIFIIDFQDSTYGPFFYDISSFLNDSLTLEFSEITYLFKKFTEVINVKRENALENFMYTSLQRSLKALGTFSKQIYLGKNKYIPLFSHSLKKSLFYIEEIGNFPNIKRFVEKGFFLLKKN